MKYLAALLLVLCSIAHAHAQVPDSAWSPNTIPVVRPMDYGDTSNCGNDGLAALNAAMAALPATGGIIRLGGANGAPWCTRKDNVWIVSKANVLVWGENRTGQITEVSAGLQDRAAIAFTAGGGGLYGVKIVGDSTRRWTTPNSNSVVFWQVSGNEVVGNDISGHSVGVFSYGPGSNSYVQGNYIHHTWADHIHYTNGFRNAYVWNNFIFNEAPSNGDDGVACVTYGPASPKCGAMEWWGNVMLHSGSGRGLAVVGGELVNIHDNVVYGSSSAGILLGSEGSKNTAEARDTTVANNQIYGAAWQVTSHTGILVTCNNAGAAPCENLSLVGNTVYGSQAGAYRTEGSVANVTSTGLVSAEPGGGTPAPPVLAIADTSMLRTRNVSFAPVANRPGLNRILVRQPSAGGLRMAYEYVVQGEPGRVAAWAAWQTARGGYLSEQRTVSSVAYALVLTPQPATLTAGLAGVTFLEQRAPALDWLWTRLDSGEY